MRKDEDSVWDPRTYEDTDYGLDPDETFEPENAGVEYDDVSLDKPHIMTVLGPIEPSELGITLVHEHLLCDPVAVTAEEPDFRLDREDFASEEIEAFVTRGGRAIVECSPRDYGRNAAGLVRLAIKAPVHLVSVTGRHKHLHASRMENACDIASLTEEFVADLRHGMDGTPARAGLIKIGTSLDEITDVERASIHAAAAAHVVTGAPVTTHTEAGTMALEQLDELQQGGVDPSRVIVGHLDRRLDFDYLSEIARRGTLLAFDQISKADYNADADRAAMLVRLIEAGYEDQLLISHDHGRKSLYIAYGGTPGITYIIERFMLDLMEAGASAFTVRKMLIENPARALAIHPPS
jgi:phosphotriesterase-related protein